MVKLPNRSQVKIDLHKITHYLLNENHPVGRGKAAFFKAFGFGLENAGELEDALRAHAYNCEVTKIDHNGFVYLYRLEGPLWSPDGRSPMVVSVWSMNTAQIPAFVTAFPGAKESKW